MSFNLRYTIAARADITRLYNFLLEMDFSTAEKAVDRIISTIEGLSEFPFATRKAPGDNALLRELIVPFGSSGYIVLIQIEDAETVSIAAVRHQREDDYH
ncbi:type II toxin-antitoxin system RelE/ParE family toxin [Rhizobium rhizogenes]|uniref:type II toxin-antitoxin system RelE/ParE family toxin n=1 Tax=Rhizobium rhizogenes TaxID=359 RepID=UPI0022CCB4FB|nr:type II toxin-antitoxin system RelE/ParE family toxin [Rhizobium rhizogenes]MCZ7479243.1 type II toxin-antitoxin system RelE/ParE family toxin [Rhizobium rhizogenes]